MRLALLQLVTLLNPVKKSRGFSLLVDLLAFEAEPDRYP
jgi:hypothetical protein